MMTRTNDDAMRRTTATITKDEYEADDNDDDFESVILWGVKLFK